MARIIVAGYIIRYPLGGNIWAHLQYIVGLARLGHDVWFVEDAGWEESCYDAGQDMMTSDATYGMRVLAGLMERFGLANRWAYRDPARAWHGPSASTIEQTISRADLFLDVGGTSYFAEMHKARRRAYVDMDPAFTQLGGFGAHGYLNEYDVLFTYGANIGRESCPVPTLGFNWRPLRPPVVLDVWKTAHSPIQGTPWTTIAHWKAYGAYEYHGETYGQKDVEFMRFSDLPRLTPHRLEMAVARDEVPAMFVEKGWHLADSLAVSRDPWRYREYIWASRGEFSVAKNGYVKSRCGWFSDRTASYLASGRPAVVQDTGLGDDLPTGCGLLVFSTMDEAVAAMDTVESDYETHCYAARELAEIYFDSDKVLTNLLDECGL